MPTPTTTPATQRGEQAGQLVAGVVVGAVLVYVGLYVTRGIVFGFVVLVIGLAYLARNRPRIGMFARGMAISGVVALIGLTAVLVAGHFG